MPAARKTRTTKKADNQSATTTKRRAKSRQAEVEPDEDEDEEDEDEAPSTSNRRKITPEIAARAKEMRDEGATWTEVIEETGFNGAQLRPHIARLEEATIDGLEDTPESVAEFRNEGYAWYAIAISLGKTLAEVKEMAAEGGADVEGRVYRSNGASAESDEVDEDEVDEDEDEDEEEDEEEEAPAPKRRSSAKKSSTKTATATKPASKAKTTRRRNPSKAA